MRTGDELTSLRAVMRLQRVGRLFRFPVPDAEMFHYIMVVQPKKKRVLFFIGRALELLPV